MLNCKKVAITGGLSCGKSSVCHFFKKLGAHIVSADEIVHHLLTPTKKIGQQVIALIGDDVVIDGKIDRKSIAKKVFEDKKLLLSLEKLIHPVVLNEIEEAYQQVSSQGKTPLFIAEIPLLFEAASERLSFDATICIWCDPEVCKERFMAVTGYGEEEYFKRMANQMPIDKKAKLADYVINNSGPLEQTNNAVTKLFSKLKSGS